MPSNRWDETWHRLREWTNSSGQSERLAAQILQADGYTNVDPVHPLGGRDGTRDASVRRDGEAYVMAVYFPRGQQKYRAIEDKLLRDYEGVSKHNAVGLAFVCNQELTASERTDLAAAVGGPLDLFHLERITALLDRPWMGSVRRKFVLEDDAQFRLEAVQTGGDSYAYLMFYNFDLALNVARELVVIKEGEFALYDLRVRLIDLLDNGRLVLDQRFGEMNTPAVFETGVFRLPAEIYWRAQWVARNGQWHQDLQLKRSASENCWLAATRVVGHQQAPEFQHLDDHYEAEFGEPKWLA